MALRQTRYAFFYTPPWLAGTTSSQWHASLVLRHLGLMAAMQFAVADAVMTSRCCPQGDLVAHVHCIGLTHFQYLTYFRTIGR